MKASAGIGADRRRRRGRGRCDRDWRRFSEKAGRGSLQEIGVENFGSVHGVFHRSLAGATYIRLIIRGIGRGFNRMLLTPGCPCPDQGYTPANLAGVSVPRLMFNRCTSGGFKEQRMSIRMPVTSRLRVALADRSLCGGRTGWLLGGAAAVGSASGTQRGPGQQDLPEEARANTNFWARSRCRSLRR